jgi:electron transport complex protein RnfB
MKMCGYCELCFGYFVDQRSDDTTAAENQRCPTNAIQRAFVEDPYYQYGIDEARCIGCGICVKGCRQFGNGSLTLQVRHDRCVSCNQCAIAVHCPAQAFRRVPATKPYLLRTEK